MAICDFNMLFTYIWNGAPGSCHDTAVLTMAQQSDPEFPLLPMEKYYVVDSEYPNMQGFLAPYKSYETMLSDIICLISMFNQYHASLRSVIEWLLEFVRKNGEFFVIFQDIVLRYKREW